MTAGVRLLGVQQPRPATPGSGALRLVRGSAVALTAMGLSVGGHVAAGGHLPRPSTAAALLALTGIVSTALSGRRWTMPALFTVLLGVQVVFHIAGAHAASGAAHQHAAHGVSSSMVLAHVLAAAIAAGALRRGESWCWLLVAMLGRPARAVRVLTTRPVVVATAGALLASDRPLPTLRALLLAEARPLRGPPVLLTG